MRKAQKASLVILSVILFSGFFPSDTDIYYRISKSIETFGKIYKEISLNYVDKINPEEFIVSGVKGMLSQLDPYTAYIDSKEQRDLEIITSGKYGGIGLSVSFDDNKVTVIELMEGYSAHRQGVRIGDIITKINDTPVDGNTQEYMSVIQKGEPGTTVQLTVKREGVDEPLRFELVREEIEIVNVSYYGFIPENSQNAYIKLSGFSRTAGDEIKKAIEQLSSRKEIRSVVLDLRGNPGGLLEAAVDVSEKFLKKGAKIVSVIGRDSTVKKEYFSKEEPIAGKYPVAVLVDNGSASASEIVAGAIQDNDRGIIIGETTFGKGLVQSVIPLSDNTSLKMTTARYYTPSGRCIQKVSYSDKNKVFENPTVNGKTGYFTLNRRKVFSAGGFVPDSTTEEGVIPQIKMRLLADGMFFKFATHYFNTHPGLTEKQMNKERIYDEFVNYIQSGKFLITQRSARLIDQLKKILKEGGYPDKIASELEQVSQEIDKAKTTELYKHKDEIYSELRDELLIRIHGRTGMIKESVKNDRTFTTALNMLNDKVQYKRVLRINE